jgi:hypothetical protein
VYLNVVCGWDDRWENVGIQKDFSIEASLSELFVFSEEVAESEGKFDYRVIGMARDG